MAQISKLSKLLQGVQRGVNLANSELLVNNVQIKAGSGNDVLYATFSGTFTAIRTISVPDANVDLANIADLVTLSGVAAGSLNLGSFSGSTIDDDQTIKAALQSLETAVESAAGTTEFADSVFRIQDDGDATKEMAFEVSAITTGTTRTITMPDHNVNLGDIATNSSSISDLETDVGDLVILSGVAVNSEHLGTFTGDIIPDSSTVKSAFQSLETFIEALPDPMEYKGVWDADANDPELADGVGDNGDVYHVAVAGSVDFGSGAISFEVGDKVVYNGATAKWEKWDMTDAVSSVNGQTGAVVLEADDIDLATGYTAAAGTVTDADTIQQALQKIDANANAAQDAADDAQEDVDDLITLSGVAANSEHLGSFTGDIIPDDQTIKSALQSLETAVESIESESLVRVALAGETLPAGVKALRWAKAADAGFVAGRLYLADNDAETVDNFHVAGLLVAAGEEAADEVTIVKAGKLLATGHSFTIGQPIFLGAGGVLTSTPPSADNLAVVKVGIAEDANTLDVAIEVVGVN